MRKYLAIILYGKNDLIIDERRIRIINYLKKITKKKEKIYLIDLTSFYLGKVQSNKIKIKDKKIIYFKPKKINELKSFTKNKIIFGIGPDIPQFKDYLSFLILKYCSIKLIIINFYGYYLSENNKNRNISEKFFYFKRIKVYYFLNRVLTILNIFPKIEHYFESSQLRINILNKSFSKKFDNFFPFIKISLFKNIHRINSIYYDEILQDKKYKISEKKIVLIDSGPGHRDTYYKSNKSNIINDEFIINYYDKVFKFLKYLNKKLNLKIIFCKHPKTYYPKKIFIKKNFLSFNFKADKEIFFSKYVIFTGGSSMFNKAIILKKRVIALVSKQTPKFGLRLMLNLNSIFKIKFVNIDVFAKKPYHLNLKYNEKKYNKFISNNLISSKEHSSVLIRKILFNVEK